MRIDAVSVRIVDTRLFHSFDSGEIIRDFNVMEETWAGLADKGHSITAEWLCSPVQSD